MRGSDTMHQMQKMVIIPVITGILLCVVSFFAVKSTDTYLPIKQGTVFAYHNEQPEKASDVKSVKANSLIGTVAFSNKKFDLVYENDYSNMKNALSMTEQSSTPDEYGCVYLKMISSNAKAVQNTKKMQLSTVYGDFKYNFTEKLTVDSEYKALSYLPRASKSVVVFYQISNGVGLSSEYELFVFEEAA